MPRRPSPPLGALASWDRSSFSADGHTFDIYRKQPSGQTGPGVIVFHELPGLNPYAIAFGQELVDAGYDVTMPHLFGPADTADSSVRSAKALSQVCASREFTKLAVGVSAPLSNWLRALARDVAAETDGPVGAIGMCFTGGFALAAMIDPAVAAPVLAQPAVPFAVDRRRGADLNLSPGDATAVAARAADGCPVLGLRYAKDRSVGTRFTTLHDLLGENFRRVELPGRGHATLTLERSDTAVAAVLEFLDERLRPNDDPADSSEK